MNGATLGSKQIVVRLHEPKQLRQEKLAQRFGHNGHPRSSSGATSPAVSETGEQLFGGWNSPRLRPSALGSPALSPKSIHFERSERGRRGSGSYYTVCFFLTFFSNTDIYEDHFVGCTQWYSQHADHL